MTAKQLVGKLHRWLGLTSGLVVFIVSITGAIFTFQDEIRDATQPWRHAPGSSTNWLAPSQLEATAVAHHAGATPSWVMYMGPGRSALILLTDKAGGYYVASVDPYSGRWLHEQNLRYDFFTIIQEIHMYLLLPVAVAKWVVGGSVLIFVAMLITGIVLWWPKRKAERRQRFTIKWGSRWRRVNYDLHNVLGFYAASVAVVLALTGLVMTFEWVSNTVYFVSNGGETYPQEKTKPMVDTTQLAQTARQPLIDLCYQQLKRNSPKAEMLYLSNPTTSKEPVYALAYGRALHYYHRDEYYFHPTTGSLLKFMPHAAKSNGAKMSDVNYDLHTGQILGLGGKIIAFLASLISASLPVTGFLVWWGRRNKAKKPRQSLKHPVSA
jgi:uncharacterized iron-regulated membrane protein